MKSDKDKQTPQANVNTHAYIQQVSRSRNITPSTKLVLIYLLEKYQTKMSDGRVWDFSNASIQIGAGLKQRIVYNITTALIKAKVLKACGKITRATRPTILYYFNLQALNDYLKANEMVIVTLEKDIATSANETLANDNEVKCHIEASTNQVDIAKDIAKDIATIAYQEEDMQKKTTKEEETESESLVQEEISNQTLAKAIEERPAVPVDGMSTPAASVSVDNVSTTLADEFDSLFNPDGSIK